MPFLRLINKKPGFSFLNGCNNTISLTGNVLLPLIKVKNNQASWEVDKTYILLRHFSFDIDTLQIGLTPP
jgi:hypothetical protein